MRRCGGGAELRTSARSYLRTLSLLACLALQVGACTHIRPDEVASPAVFSHEEFARVLARFVDADGRVDYAGLQRERGALDRYYALIAACSPDATPALFPTRADRLAYWLNAYNATVLRTVLEYYPVASVADIPPWLPSKFGFFYLQLLTYGGTRSNLYDLEQRVVRGRFHEPRVHFALNCASAGCPRLPREPFTGAALDAQLDRETRRFLAEPRNVRIDHAARVVHLSAIFDWYADDFTTWPPLAARPHATLLDYVALYSPPDRATDLTRAAAYEIRFLPYDWSLNDQHPPE